jgi:hypothetical protein
MNTIRVRLAHNGNGGDSNLAASGCAVTGATSKGGFVGTFAAVRNPTSSGAIEFSGLEHLAISGARDQDDYIQK